MSGVPVVPDTPRPPTVAEILGWDYSRVVTHAEWMSPTGRRTYVPPIITPDDMLAWLWDSGKLYYGEPIVVTYRTGDAHVHFFRGDNSGEWCDFAAPTLPEALEAAVRVVSGWDPEVKS